MNEKLKVRLLKEHFLNGRKRNEGTVVRMNKFAAEWLIKQNRAKLLPERIQ